MRRSRRIGRADHDVLVRRHATKRHHRPIVGDVAIRYEALQLADEDPAAPTSRLVVTLARPSMR